MRRQRLIVCAVVVLVLLFFWAALAAWQRHEYDYERELAQETLRRQAESIRSALVGGIRSHRRLGRFFEGMLQGTLDELAASKDILAVGIASEDPSFKTGRLELLLYAGQKELLDASSASDVAGVRFVHDFQLAPDAGAGPHGPGGGGRGRGRGQRWQAEQDDEGPFSAGGRFTSILVLDRTQTDAQIHGAFWLRLWVVVAGGLVLGCVSLAWLATVWLVQARGHARVLESEARHLCEMSQAAAGLAHETRNPLGLVRGWTQRLAQSNLRSPEQQQQARAIVEECDRVTARINQFLAFARPCEPKPEPVDADRLVAELAVLLEPDLESRGLKLEHSGSKPPGMIHVDREMFRQALFNLVRNAIQFAPKEGTVEIFVRTGQDGGGRIEVADRGPGVPEENVDSLFTPYFTTRADGTGLGLAVVRRIAAAHGWEVGYTPRAGGGSIFWLDQTHG